MTIYNLLLRKDDLGVLSPRETSEMCLVFSNKILTYFIQTLLYFHPAEQAQLISFRADLNRYLCRLNGVPTQSDPLPKVTIHNVKIHFDEGTDDGHFNMKLHIIYFVNLGPPAMIKLLEAIYKVTFQYFDSTLHSAHHVAVINNCKVRYRNIIRMMTRLCLQVRNQSVYRINQQTVIGPIKIQLEVLYS